jgi:hypothetical protein
MIGAHDISGLMPGDEANLEELANRRRLTGLYLQNYFNYMVTTIGLGGLDANGCGCARSRCETAEGAATDRHWAASQRAVASCPVHHGWNDPAISPLNTVNTTKGAGEDGTRRRQISCAYRQFQDGAYAREGRQHG